MNHTFHKAVLITLLSLSSSIVQSEQTTHSKDVYTEPKLINRTSPNYPPHELEDANAGAVEVIFMVDKTGKTFEPILGYTSKPQFGIYALNAIKNYRYKPATLNGKPIDSLKRLRVDFAVQDQDDQVSQQFRKHYRTASKELSKENPNKNKIKKRINSMANSSHMSPYSYRHLNSIKHHYASLFKDEQAQIGRRAQN